MGSETDRAHRLATLLQRLAEQMDTDLAAAWGSLTWLQMGTLRTIARLGEVSRSDLSHAMRTSRAALVPGLSRLLRDGLITEHPPGLDALLSVAAPGWARLRRIEQLRARWILDAARSWSEDELHATTHAIEQLLTHSDSDSDSDAP